MLVLKHVRDDGYDGGYTTTNIACSEDKEKLGLRRDALKSNRNIAQGLIENKQDEYMKMAKESNLPFQEAWMQNLPSFLLYKKETLKHYDYKDCGVGADGEKWIIEEVEEI